MCADIAALARRDRSPGESAFIGSTSASNLAAHALLAAAVASLPSVFECLAKAAILARRRRCSGVVLMPAVSACRLFDGSGLPPTSAPEFPTPPDTARRAEDLPCRGGVPERAGAPSVRALLGPQPI